MKLKLTHVTILGLKQLIASRLDGGDKNVSCFNRIIKKQREIRKNEARD